MRRGGLVAFEVRSHQIQRCNETRRGCAAFVLQGFGAFSCVMSIFDGSPLGDTDDGDQKVEPGTTSGAEPVHRTTQKGCIFVIVSQSAVTLYFYHSPLQKYAGKVLIGFVSNYPKPQSFCGPVLVHPVSFLFICTSHVRVRASCKQLKEIVPHSWKQAHSYFLRLRCTRRLKYPALTSL